MSELAQMAKIIALVSGLTVTGYGEGVGAFYHQADMREVCEARVRNAWYPKSANLNCDWPCLAASIDVGELGDYVLAYLPGGSYHV